MSRWMLVVVCVVALLLGTGLVHARPIDIASDSVAAVVAGAQTLLADSTSAERSDKMEARDSVGHIPEPPRPVDLMDAGLAAVPRNDSASALQAEPEIPVARPMMDLAVVIPTVRRFQHDGAPAPEHYLKPMVEKLWDDMSVEDQKHVRFFILNSDKAPEQHTEAVELSTHPGVTVFTKVENKKELLAAMSGLSTLEDGREVSGDWLKWVASENIDGAFLFEKARSEAPYILFLEDDVRPTTNALRKLSDFMAEFELTHKDWLFIDLYTPNLDWAPGMLEAANGERYNFQCCTQAMLFKSERITGVINYWRDHASEPVDDNLRNYMRDVVYDLSVYAVVPNLFEHVGAYSSNADKSTGVVEHASLSFVPLLIQKEAKAGR